MVTTFANTPCVDPSLLYRDCRDRGLPVDWLGKANVFRVPAGRGPGTGGILLTRGQLDSIDSGTSHQLKFEGGTGDTVILRDITLTGSTCIWPSSESSLSAVYLCTLADRRHFLARSGAVGKAYNLRDRRGEYLTATTNGGTPWTWSGLWGQLWLPSEGTAPTLPFTPNGTPENFVYYDVGRWEAVNDFMDRLACHLVFDPRSGSFSVVRLGSADPATDASLKAIHDVRTWDTYPSEPTRAWCPETIQVLFKRLPEPTDGSNPFYAVDIGLSGVSGTESGTVVILHDDLTAKGANGTPSNAGDLTSRANERATDWHRRRRPDRSRLLQVYHDGRMDGFEALHSVATEVAIGERGAGVSTEAKASPDDALETWPKYDWRRGEGEEWPKMARLTARNEDGYYSWVETILKKGTVGSDPNDEVYGTLTGEYNARAMTPWELQELPVYAGGSPGNPVNTTATLVEIWPNPDNDTEYAIRPVGSATATVTGLVDIADQTWEGVKSANDGFKSYTQFLARKSISTTPIYINARDDIYAYIPEYSDNEGVEFAFVLASGVMDLGSEIIRINKAGDMSYGYGNLDSGALCIVPKFEYTSKFSNVISSFGVVHIPQKIVGDGAAESRFGGLFFQDRASTTGVGSPLNVSEAVLVSPAISLGGVICATSADPAGYAQSAKQVYTSASNSGLTLYDNTGYVDGVHSGGECANIAITATAITGTFSGDNPYAFDGYGNSGFYLGRVRQGQDSDSLGIRDELGNPTADPPGKARNFGSLVFSTSVRNGGVVSLGNADIVAAFGNAVWAPPGGSSPSPFAGMQTGVRYTGQGSSWGQKSWDLVANAQDCFLRMMSSYNMSSARGYAFNVSLSVDDDPPTPPDHGNVIFSIGSFPGPDHSWSEARNFIAVYEDGFVALGAPVPGYGTPDTGFDSGGGFTGSIDGGTW